MWIIPKNLHTSAYALDTEALTLDLSELSIMCEQSLMWRSKPFNVRTWSQRWKKVGWMQHLFGRILRPSHGEAFVEKWTSSVVASLVNLSQVQVEEQEMRILAIYGHTSSEESKLSDLPLFSWKTLKASSVQNFKATNGATRKELQFCFMSLESWRDWVIKQRRAYSQRLKLERHTKEKECLFLVSEMTSHIKAGNGSFKNWATPRANKIGSENLEKWKKRAEKGQVSTMPLGLQVEVSEQPTPHQEEQNNTHMNHQELNWATPTTRDWKDAGLRKEVKPMKDGTRRMSLVPQQVLYQEGYKGKLSPRWVEMLMGLPIGWTMPNCANPVIIEQTNSEVLGMEWCHKPPPLLLQDYSENVANSEYIDEFKEFVLKKENGIVYYDAEQILLYLEKQFKLLLKQEKIKLLEPPFDSCWGYACEEFFDNIGGQGLQGVEFVFPSYSPQDHDQYQA